MKKLIVFDLDGTLAKSKAALDDEMSSLLGRLLHVVKVAIISGGDFPQFQTQVVGHLPADSDLANLSLLPTCGTKFFVYDGEWKKLYSEDLSPEQKQKIESSLEAAVAQTGLQPNQTWGERIEDRGTQITYSALGQQAPLEAKSTWDPDFSKRKKIKAILDTMLPDFSVALGGTTFDRRHAAGDRQGVRHPQAARHPLDTDRGDVVHRRCALSGRQRLPGPHDRL